MSIRISAHRPILIREDGEKKKAPVPLPLEDTLEIARSEEVPADQVAMIAELAKYERELTAIESVTRATDLRTVRQLEKVRTKLASVNGSKETLAELRTELVDRIANLRTALIFDRLDHYRTRPGAPLDKIDAIARDVEAGAPAKQIAQALVELEAHFMAIDQTPDRPVAAVLWYGHPAGENPGEKEHVLKTARDHLGAGAIVEVSAPKEEAETAVALFRRAIDEALNKIEHHDQPVLDVILVGHGALQGGDQNLAFVHLDDMLPIAGPQLADAIFDGVDRFRAKTGKDVPVRIIATNCHSGQLRAHVEERALEKNHPHFRSGSFGYRVDLVTSALPFRVSTGLGGKGTVADVFTSLAELGRGRGSIDLLRDAPWLAELDRGSTVEVWSTSGPVQNKLPLDQLIDAMKTGDAWTKGEAEYAISKRIIGPFALGADSQVTTGAYGVALSKALDAAADPQASALRAGEIETTTSAVLARIKSAPPELGASLANALSSAAGAFTLAGASLARRRDADRLRAAIEVDRRVFADTVKRELPALLEGVQEGAVLAELAELGSQTIGVRDTYETLRRNPAFARKLPRKHDATKLNDEQLERFIAEICARM